MPPQDGVRRHDRGDLEQHLPTEDLTLHCLPSPLVIVQEDPLLAEFFFEHVVLGAQVFNHL
ncbi:MAG: hypothetical protein CMJ64_17500 [Planctomycetaceae bacterium]|nr:hypothetical protein [Planctomycetaceae bacterium]